VGVRWEPYEAMVLSVSYQEQWIDVKAANGTPTVGKFIFEIGYNY
jgi:hypothetical protein